MNQESRQISIDQLIEIVRKGGKIRTGIDVCTSTGTLLLKKDILVERVTTLLNVKNNGIFTIPIVPGMDGGVWDKLGHPISLKFVPPPEPPPEQPKKIIPAPGDISRKIQEINAVKRIARTKYTNAKKNIKKILSDIQASKGEFNPQLVEETVTDLFNFVTLHKNAFSYLSKEIFSYDDYLYNHSINVCTLGTVIMEKFNDHFNAVVNKYLFAVPVDYFRDKAPSQSTFVYFFPEELRNISIGFFMHDIGKVLIPQAILNKKGRLNEEEFALVRTHSSEKGSEILRKNNMHDPIIHNIATYHHARMFQNENRCYPDTKAPDEIPTYVKVCKLADIYDAMTSKRCYKDAFNPVAVVADLFHQYAEKDRLLQFILHAFVKAIGIYPPGSIVTLGNGQLAYIIDSEGPIILPFTDTSGEPVTSMPDPVDLSDPEIHRTGLAIDRNKPLLSPAKTFDKMPAFLKKMHMAS